ncbi:MAG: hypothetical protein P8104_12630, partial [Gammaproteobacteria bacterium]
FAYDHCRFFSLHFTVRFSVEEPRVLVERLNNDPVKRVQDEIKRRVGQAVRQYDWLTIKNDFETVMDAVLEDDHPAMVKIQDRAKEYGIFVEEILIGCRLDEQETVVDRGILAEESKRALMSLETDTEHHRLKLEASLASSRADLEALKFGFHAKATAQKVIVEAFETSVKSLAANIGSAEDLQHASQTLVELLQDRLPTLMLGTSTDGEDVSKQEERPTAELDVPTNHAPEAQTPEAPSSEPEPVLLREKVEGEQEGEGEQESKDLWVALQQAMAQLESVTCDQPLKEQLQASLVHVRAERALGLLGNGERCAHYTQQLQAQIAELPEANPQFEAFIKRIVNLEKNV